MANLDLISRQLPDPPGRQKRLHEALRHPGEARSIDRCPEQKKGHTPPHRRPLQQLRLHRQVPGAGEQWPHQSRHALHPSSQQNPLHAAASGHRPEQPEVLRQARLRRQRQDVSQGLQRQCVPRVRRGWQRHRHEVL